jgi:NAD(P)H-dependent flavin oxidoreductase YrpB (nitropropane dioxygenase family)
VWLTTPEAETAQITKEKMVAASSRDTLRSKYRTGKYSRQLRTAWHDAWGTQGSPDPLPMPLMGAVAEPALRLVDREAEKGNPGARELATYWVGQAVGLMNSIRSVKDVMLEMKEDYATAVGRVSQTVDFE